jgi:hypothetical protein
MGDRYQSVEKRVGSETPNKKKLNWILFSPVIFAPLIPLTRVVLTRGGYSHKVVSRATIGMICLALVHGVAVMSRVDSIS